MSNLHKVLTNRKTQEQIVLPKPKDAEIEIFDNSLLITEMDVNGVITYANRRFCKVSEYTKEELIGMPYSITCHPDMPEGLLVALWKIVRTKKIWRGYIKSLAKSGRYYWTLMYMQAKLDENREIVGYTATRRKAYSSARMEAEDKYNERQGKAYIDDEYFMRAELFHGDNIATLY